MERCINHASTPENGVVMNAIGEMAGRDLIIAIHSSLTTAFATPRLPCSLSMLLHRVEGRRANEERDCSRSRSRDAPEEPTTCSTSSWGLIRKTLPLWQTNILARRPPGTRRTEYVFSLAEVGGKSGKAQFKNSSFSPVRHDATPGGM